MEFVVCGWHFGWILVRFWIVDEICVLLMEFVDLGWLLAFGWVVDERTCGSTCRSFSGWEVESRVGFLLNLQQLILVFFILKSLIYFISIWIEPAVHVRLPVALVCQHVPTREGVLKIIYKFERSELDAILWLVVCSNLNVLLYQNNFLWTLL